MNWALVILVTVVVGSLQPARSAAQSGVSSTEITLGTVGPLSGPRAAFFLPFYRGLELYVRALNDEGGVHGRKIRLVPGDAKDTPDTAIGELNRLIEVEKVFAFVGNSLGAAQTTAEKILDERKMLDFGPLTLSDRHGIPAERGRFSFRVLPALRHEAQAGYKHLTRRRGMAANRIAVLAPDTPLAKMGADSVENLAAAQGAKLAARIVIDLRQDRATAVRMAVQGLVPMKPGAVVLFGVAPLVEQLAAELTSRRLEPVWLATDEAVPWRFTEKLKELVMVTGVPSPDGSNRPGAIAYREHLKKYAPGAAPGYESLMGYATAKVFAEALRLTGKELTTDRVVTTLEKFRRWDSGILGPITYTDKNHLGTTGAFVAEFKQGKRVGLEVLAVACCDECQPTCKEQCVKECAD
ncbi:MAG: ABC transporter substrate-binding protein [Candidatus Rokubacteria bacterium]|nr:ABC transporter substrate-binding protein [Candidatus Rokubacteria bacterium]